MDMKTLLAAALLMAMSPGTRPFDSASGLAQDRQGPQLPAEPLKFGGFSARFGADGVFALEGQGSPAFKGTWKQQGNEIEQCARFPNGMPGKRPDRGRPLRGGVR